ncbi:MAG: NADH:flavin oxidoreductase [Oscillospiraceae bacterium]|nr:NADH:flavin oxidoreductase [Oscillospiraceae bacterium]
MKKVFEPVEFKKMKLKNRLVRSATWEGLANPDGGLPEETYAIYEELAKGGAGGIITGFTSVALNDFYFGGMMRLCDDALIPQYRRLVDIIHREHCPAVAQLALGAYYRPVGNGKFTQVEPDDMTVEEIRIVESQFIDAAVRAQKAGFDGVQLHIAHFFFLSRFVSPAVNHREDEYGGSSANRARIVLEIMAGIRAIAPGLYITAKINSSDFTYGGLDNDESLELCKLIALSGIDSIEVSGNGTSVSGIRAHVNEGYFLPFAARLAEEVDVPVMLVGGFRALDTMEAVLNQTKIELITLSRPLLCEPDLPKKMQADPKTVSRCISCNRCYSSDAHRCVFRR